MKCPNCGTELVDDAKFCNKCGAALAGAKAASEKPACERAVTQGHVGASAATRGSIDAELSEARSKSHRKIPMFLLVILIVLALAAVAFAAYVVYTNLVAPQQQVQTQQEQPSSTIEAQTTEQPATVDVVAQQKAVYNDVLTAWKADQASGWTSGGSGVTANDLESVDMVASGTMKGTSSGSSTLTSGTPSYAYFDLGSDGVLDLVVGTDKGALLGAYSTDGSQATSLSNVNTLGLSKAQWAVCSDGYLMETASDGASSHSMVFYTVSGGKLVSVDDYEQEGSSITKNGTSISTGDWTAAQGAHPAATLEWHPLSDFTATSQAAAATVVQSDAISEDGWSFQLPAYWKDKVNVTKDDSGTVKIAPIDNPSSYLCTFQVVASRDQIMDGDYSEPTISSWQLANGKGLELSCTNYIYKSIASTADSPTGSSDIARATELIDLQTGGTVTYRQALDSYMAQETSGMDMTVELAGKNWMKDNLASTVKVG